MARPGLTEVTLASSTSTLSLVVTGFQFYMEMILEASRISFLFGKCPSLVTSQNVTAPKPLSQNLPCKETSILPESEIISEQSSRSTACLFSLLLS